MDHKLKRNGLTGSIKGNRVLTPDIERYWKNPEKARATRKKYYWKKREYLLEKRKRDRSSPDAKKHTQESNAEYYRKNRLRIALKRKERRDAIRALQKTEAETARLNNQDS